MEGLTVNIEKHLRRKHQFELLCFQIATLSQDFEHSPLFSQLMKNCKIEHAKLFIKSNIKKFRATTLVEVEIVPIETNIALPVDKVGSNTQLDNTQTMVSDISTQCDEIVQRIKVKENNVTVLDELVTEEVIEIKKEEGQHISVRDDALKSVSNAENRRNVKTAGIDIIDKSNAFNKAQATEIMKQFFRAFVKDDDCKHFLKSRGEEMPIGMVDKLVFFLFDVSSSYQESFQLIKFAVKNLKRILETDGSLKPTRYIFESDSFLNLKKIHKYIIQYKKYCKWLHMNPKNCSSDILISLVSKLFIQEEGVADHVPIFLSWLGKYHQKKGGKSVDHLEEMVKLATRAKMDREVYKQSNGKTVFEMNVFKCEKCDETFECLFSVLLHTGSHGETPVDVFCTKCEENVETIFIREKKDTVTFRSILLLHLTNRSHVHNSLNSIKLPLGETMCHGCDVSFSSPSEIVNHVSSSDHVANIIVVQEYLEFCLALQLDPVNHSDFPHFIFFLRCIHSLSVNLHIPIRQTMDVVANIHSNFNSLLNVNESSDVKDEVVRKLSLGDPATSFCYSCNQSFLTVSDIEDHLSDYHCSTGIKEYSPVRCIVCKDFISQKHLKEHAHDITDSSRAESECNVEVIDIDDGGVRQSTDAGELQSEIELIHVDNISTALKAPEVPHNDGDTAVITTTDQVSDIPDELSSDTQNSAIQIIDETEGFTSDNPDESEVSGIGESSGFEAQNDRLEVKIAIDSNLNETVAMNGKKIDVDTLHREDNGLKDDLLPERINSETIAIIKPNNALEVTNENSHVGNDQLSDLVQDAISLANISIEDLNFQDKVENCKVADAIIVDTSQRDLDCLNDNVIFEEKHDDGRYSKDQNNSNIIPSWEFVPIKGKNFQFHVFPPVESIPADPVEDIKYDFSLKDILEMHKKGGGLFERNQKDIKRNAVDEKRKSSSIDSYLTQYKKLKMGLNVSVSHCEYLAKDAPTPSDNARKVEEKIGKEEFKIHAQGLVSTSNFRTESSDNSELPSTNPEDVLDVHDHDLMNENKILNMEAEMENEVTTGIEEDPTRGGAPSQENEISLEVKESKNCENIADPISSGTEDIVKKILFKTGLIQNASPKSLENEFEFDFIEPENVAGDSEVKGEDSSSDYEDSDDELEIIEEIVVDEGTEKEPDPSRSVKLEAGSNELRIETSPEMSTNIRIEDPQLMGPGNEATIEKQFLAEGDQHVNGKSVKRKFSEGMASTSTNNKHQLRRFDVKMVDVALAREWKALVDPQVAYLKNRAAVITRWESDIQAYFKQKR